jgi:hypothetical protein
MDQYTWYYANVVEVLCCCMSILDSPAHPTTTSFVMVLLRLYRAHDLRRVGCVRVLLHHTAGFEV